MSLKRKIRILVVITKLSLGGAGKFVVQLVKGLNSEGFEVTLLYGTEELNLQLEKEVKFLGIKTIKNDFLVRDIKLQYDIKALLSLIKMIKKNKFDIIHAHTTKAGVLCRLVKILIHQNIPLLYNPHGHIYDKNAKLPGVDSYLKRIIFFLIEKIANIFSNAKVICVSEKEYKEILNMGYSSKFNTFLIPNGLSLEKQNYIHYEDSLSYEILVVGRFSMEKGQDIAMKAMKEIRGYNNRFTMTFVGDGPLKEELIKLRKELELEDCVRILPSQTQLDNFFKAAFCVLIPSRYEGFSMTALEAFKFKKPVVITKNCGIARHLQDKVEALIVSANSRDICNAILQLGNDPNLYKILAENAYNKLLSEFTFEVTLKNYLSVYYKLLKVPIQR
jgi:glycosyltransferase involved in cell wall biosynthesis